MKYSVKNISKAIYKELKSTAFSINLVIKKIVKGYVTIVEVFSRPENVIYGFFTSFGSVLLAMWLANILIIQDVFESSAITTAQKASYLFSMLEIPVRAIDTLQIVLILVHIFLAFVLFGLWLEAMTMQHERPKTRHALIPLIFSSLFFGALTLLGISLITPVITRAGLSIYVSSHYSGTMILILGLIAEAVLIKKFVTEIHRLKK